MLSAIQLDPLTPVTYTPDKLPDTMINYMNQGHTLLQNANGDYYSISPYGDSNNINPYIMRDRGTTKRDGFVFSGSTYLDLLRLKNLSSLHVWDIAILIATPMAILCLTLPVLIFIKIMYR